MPRPTTLSPAACARHSSVLCTAPRQAGAGRCRHTTHVYCLPWFSLGSEQNGEQSRKRTSRAEGGKQSRGGRAEQEHAMTSQACRPCATWGGKWWAAAQPVFAGMPVGRGAAAARGACWLLAGARGGRRRAGDARSSVLQGRRVQALGARLAHHMRLSQTTLNTVKEAAGEGRQHGWPTSAHQTWQQAGMAAPAAAGGILGSSRGAGRCLRVDAPRCTLFHQPHRQPVGPSADELRLPRLPRRRRCAALLVQLQVAVALDGVPARVQAGSQPVRRSNSSSMGQHGARAATHLLIASLSSAGHSIAQRIF